ncbi:tetratricopeptide repeat protein, partial [Phascolarctobacterium succinatutens]|uniref:tetratricopeptide repeat protein n=1 Tax=Phascolarctobacterium succinatutens TaxID=626940 RepID=UPI0034C6C290
EAVKWYRKGAEAGNANAMANLGWMYDWGKGVDQNAEETKKWYKKAADCGNAWAKEQLSSLSY